MVEAAAVVVPQGDLSQLVVLPGTLPPNQIMTMATQEVDILRVSMIIRLVRKVMKSRFNLN